MSKPISDYYDIATLTDDDIIVVAMLIQVMQLVPSSKVVGNLEDLKLHYYEKELGSILDLKIDTIKDLKDIFKSKSMDFGIKKLDRKMTDKVNLLNFINEEF